VDKLDALSRRLSAGDIAFFFFAGHGVSLGGGNYVPPSDVPNIEPGQEIRLARASLGEAEIVADLQSRGVRVAVVVLDACRNNPFVRPGSRSIGAERGLARVEPSRGIFMLYSAGIGQVALDRLNDRDADPNSVFTRALVPSLTRPGLDLGALAVGFARRFRRSPAASAMANVPPITTRRSGAASVSPAAEGDQRPGLARPVAGAFRARTAGPHDRSGADVASIEHANKPAEFELFAKRSPDSPHAELARVRMKSISPVPRSRGAAPPARPGCGCGSCPARA
jgi:hypothetical protein